MAMGAAKWQECTHMDGRKYWFNNHTNTSYWEKPDELKTISELELGRCAWKEFTAKDGRKYYYHSQTKETVWQKPKEFQDAETRILLKKQGIEPPPAAASASPAPVVALPPPQGAIVDPSASPAVTAGETAAEGTPKVYTYATKEEARAAFREMMTELKCLSSWKWDKVMRHVFSDPRYDALKQMNEKKKVWNTWKQIRAKEEKEEARQRVRQARETLKAFLLAAPDLGENVTYEGAMFIFAHDPEWKAVRDERDRRHVFHDAMDGRIRARKEADRQHKEALRKEFSALLVELDLTFESTWTETFEKLELLEGYQQNEKLKAAPKIECLIAFEGLVLAFEEQEKEARHAKRDAKRRQHRKDREAYIELLTELEASGDLKRNTKWKEAYPKLGSDPRYLSLLGHPGTTGIDLFKLRQDALRRKLHDDKRAVRSVAEDLGVVVTLDTTIEEFMKALQDDERIRAFTIEPLTGALEALKERAAHKARQQEKEKRRALGRAFKDMVLAKKLDLKDRWKDVRDKLKEEQAFKDIASDGEREDLFEDAMDEAEEADYRSHRQRKHSSRRHHDDDDRRRSSSSRKRRHTDSEDSGDDGERSSSHRRKKKRKEKSSRKKKKKKRAHSDRSSDSEADSRDRSRRRSHEHRHRSDRSPEKRGDDMDALEKQKDALLRKL